MSAPAPLRQLRILLAAAFCLGTATGNANDAGSACAPGVPEPTPAGVATTLFQSRAADGTCLQGYVWQPSGASPRAVVVVVHGIRDHATRYGALAQALVAQRIAVVAQDHRGHGRSGGARQRFDSIEQVAADVALGVHEAQRRIPGVPTFLFGHSMGGLTVTWMGLQAPHEFRGIVLSGAALRLGADATFGKRVAVRVLGRVWPSLKVQPVDDSLFVRDPAAKRAQAEDPLIDHDDLPAVSALAFLRGIEAVTPRLGEFAVPLLALHGTADVSTDPQGSHLLVQRAAVADKTMLDVEGSAHDVLHETEGPRLIDEIAAWVVKRL